MDDRPVVEVLEALDGAIEAALVAATDRRGRYAFAHALVGETIVRALPASRRARLHLQLADVLADRHDGRRGAAPARSSGTCAAPGRWPTRERLATWELAAAREAAAALAHAEAAAHYEAALAARAGAGSRARRAAARAGPRPRPRGAARTGPRRVRGGRRARPRARATADLLARAALGHGGMAVVIAAADPTAVRLLEEALAAAPAGDPATSARLLARLSVELYYADPARARELSALAVERARSADDAAALAAALNAQRVALWSPHHADERLAVAGDMIAAAEAAGDREAVLQGRNWRVVDLLELGRIREAAAEIDAYEALADAVALPHFRWYVPLWRGTLALLAGRWAEARRAGGAGARARTPGRRPERPAVRRDPAPAQPLHPAAHRRDRTARGSSRAARPRPPPAEWLVNLALIDAETGATEDARRLVAELARDGCSALAMDANWHGACILAEAAVLVGDREAGAALYALLEPHAQLFPLIARGGRMPRVQRVLRRAPRRPARAPRRGRRPAAPRGGRERPRRRRAARRRRARCASARRSPQRGEQDAARDVLQQAAGRADALGMPALAADAARLLGATVA